MPDIAGTKIIANSRILDGLAVAVLNEREESVGANLLRVLRRPQHVICVTGNLKLREYAPASRRYGLSLLLPALQQLENRGIIRKCRSGGRPRLTGIRQVHRRFFEEAVRTGSRYFLTRRQEWLNLRQLLESNHALLVVTPEEYVRLQVS